MMPATLDILIVDDDAPLRDMLTRSFAREGHRITAVADGHGALAEARDGRFDVVLLDVALGHGPNGHDVCRTMRARRDVTPIIMLTALDSEADAVQGLEAGADDYVTKPFGLAELRSRIRAVLRRAGGRVAGDELVEIGGIRLDREARTVSARGARGPRHVRRVRAAQLPDGPRRAPRQPPGAAARDLGRQRLPRPARDRRPHPPPAREARGRARATRADPDGPRRRLPLQGAVRARLLLALVATSAVTLLAAAAALLSPLQDRLRDQSRESLQTAAFSAREQLDDAVRRGNLARADEIANGLASRTNSLYALYDGKTGRLSPPPGEDGPEAWRAFADGRSVTTQNGGGIHIAIPLAVRRSANVRTPRAVLSIRKEDTNLTQVVDEVERAFITAALIGLGVALAFGVVLSSTLSRRLARLRRGAQRIVREGPDAPAPFDERRDELGDLARAMAEMQQALRRQEHARRHFVATASHELRTPLTSLMGTLELLAEDLEADAIDVEDARTQVRAAQADLERLRALAAELLDLSRLDAGVDLRGEPVELGELSRAVAAEFALRADGAEQVLTVMPPPGPCWAHGDPDAVARITRILIDNALRYAPEGATITVAASYSGEHALLRSPTTAPASRRPTAT